MQALIRNAMEIRNQSFENPFFLPLVLSPFFLSWIGVMMYPDENFLGGVLKYSAFILGEYS
jgi:hypothetical protein